MLTFSLVFRVDGSKVSIGADVLFMLTLVDILFLLTAPVLELRVLNLLLVIKELTSFKIVELSLKWKISAAVELFLFSENKSVYFKRTPDSDFLIGLGRCNLVKSSLKTLLWNFLELQDCIKMIELLRLFRCVGVCYFATIF